MKKFSTLFSEGSHPKSVIIYYVISAVFISIAFVIGISNNPPGIILLLLGIFITGFAYFRRRKGMK